MNGRGYEKQNKKRGETELSESHPFVVGNLLECKEIWEKRTFAQFFGGNRKRKSLGLSRKAVKIRWEAYHTIYGSQSFKTLPYIVFALPISELPRLICCLVYVDRQTRQ